MNNIDIINEKDELFKLIVENPKLPVMAMADADECMIGDYNNVLMRDLTYVKKCKIYIYIDRVYDSIEDLKEAILENEDIEEINIKEKIDSLEQYDCILCYFEA